ncbi:MAG: hypothetical protein FWD40_08735 [Treponema sp.]|nr:hypothetical protein [Treponema sp.]
MKSKILSVCIILFALTGFLLTGCDLDPPDGGGRGGDGSESSPFVLSAGQWRHGEITDAGDSVWYTLSVAEDFVYYFYINDQSQGDGTKTLNVKYTAYLDDVRVEEGNWSHWDYPLWFWAEEDGTLKIKVEAFIGTHTGTFSFVYVSSDDWNYEPVRPAHPFNPPNPSALAENVWVDGEIENIGDMDWYTLDVTAGDYYYIWPNANGYYNGNGSKTAYIDVAIRHNDGEFFETNYFDYGWNQPLIIYAEEDETLFIRVRGNYSTTGTYGIVYSTEDERPSVFNVSDVIELDAGEWKDDEITSSKTEVWYSITASNSGYLSIWWNDFNQGNGDKTLDIVVSAWRLSDEVSIFSNEDSAWSNPMGDYTYFNTGDEIIVKVTPKTPGAAGTFGIAYDIGFSDERPWLEPSSAIELEDGEWAEGELTENSSEDWYTLDVTSNTNYYFWVNSSYYGDGTKSAQVIVIFYRSDGTPINSYYYMDIHDPRELSWDFDDTVFIKVNPLYSGYGTYSIAYSEIDSRPPVIELPDLADTIELEMGQWMDGEITAQVSEIWYSVGAYEYILGMLWLNDSKEGNGEKTLDAVVTVWDVSGYPLVNVFDSAWHNPKDFYFNDTIFIRVTPKIPGSTGTFGIALDDYYSGSYAGRPWIEPVNTTALSNGQWKDGVMTISTNEIWYTFNVTSGTTYRIWWNDSYQGSGKTADVVVSAYSDTGTPIFTNVDSGWNVPQSFTAGFTGTVFVEVVPWSGDTGTFGIVYSTGISKPAL